MDFFCNLKIFKKLKSLGAFRLVPLFWLSLFFYTRQVKKWQKLWQEFGKSGKNKILLWYWRKLASSLNKSNILAINFQLHLLWNCQLLYNCISTGLANFYALCAWNLRNPAHILLIRLAPRQRLKKPSADCINKDLIWGLY